MPSRYWPAYTVEVDWDGDGTFSHAAADATDHVVFWDVAWGCDPNLSDDRVETAHALGAMTVHNEDFKFDPDSTQAQVDENDLRRVNRCRIRVGDVIQWEGVVSPTGANGTGRERVFRWGLRGRHALRLTTGDTAPFTRSGGNLAQLAAAYAQHTGIPFEGGTVQQVGYVDHDGPGILFMDRFGRYGGGWCLEDRHGNWRFVRFSETAGHGAPASLSLAHGPIDRSENLGERPLHVRNRASAVARGFVAGVDDDGNERTVVMARASRLMRANTRVTLNLGSIGGGRVAKTWSAPVTPDSTVAQVESWSASGGRVTAVVRALGFSGNPRVIQVTASATYTELASYNPRELEVDLYDTVETYGPRVLDLPPWFPTDYEGAVTWTYPWLANLSQPLELFQISYSELQDDEDMWAELAAADPGRPFFAQVVVDGQAVTLDGLCLRVQMTGGLSTPPVRTITAVRRRSQPIAPLTISAEDVLTTTARLELSHPTTGKFRSGRVSAVAADPSLVNIEHIATFSDPGVENTERLLSPLLAATEYEYAFWRDGDEGAPEPPFLGTGDDQQKLAYPLADLRQSAVFASFETAVSVTQSLELTSVTVNGQNVPLSYLNSSDVWVYSSNSSPVTLTPAFVRKDAANTSGSGAVAQSGLVDGDVATFTFVVTSGGQSKNHVLRVRVDTVLVQPVTTARSYGAASLDGVADNGDDILVIADGEIRPVTIATQEFGAAWNAPLGYPTSVVLEYDGDIWPRGTSTFQTFTATVNGVANSALRGLTSDGTHVWAFEKVQLLWTGNGMSGSTWAGFFRAFTVAGVRVAAEEIGPLPHVTGDHDPYDIWRTSDGFGVLFYHATVPGRTVTQTVLSSEKSQTSPVWVALPTLGPQTESLDVMGGVNTGAVRTVTGTPSGVPGVNGNWSLDEALSGASSPSIDATYDIPHLGPAALYSYDRTLGREYETPPRAPADWRDDAADSDHDGLWVVNRRLGRIEFVQAS